jgi:hypothetical protein
LSHAILTEGVHRRSLNVRIGKLTSMKRLLGDMVALALDTISNKSHIDRGMSMVISAAEMGATMNGFHLLPLELALNAFPIWGIANQGKDRSDTFDELTKIDIR